MGHLDFADRLFLARLLMAMLDRDYDMVAKLHMNAGVLGEDVSLHRFAQSVRAVADPSDGENHWRCIAGNGAWSDFPALDTVRN